MGGFSLDEGVFEAKMKESETFLIRNPVSRHLWQKDAVAVYGVTHEFKDYMDRRSEARLS